MIDVRVTDDYMIDGLAIFVSAKLHGDGRTRQLLRLGAGGSQTWEDVDTHTNVEPTLKLPGEAARALLDALLRHYEGASDQRTVRSDLLHERGRVDKLTDALIMSSWRQAGA